LERSEICGMDGTLRVTLEDLRNSIDKLVKEKKVSEAAKILWATNVTDNADDPNRNSVMPGSILLGLEWLEDGEVAKGTLRVEPPAVASKYLN